MKWRHIFCFTLLFCAKFFKTILYNWGSSSILLRVIQSIAASALCLSCSLFLPLRGDFVQLPSTVCLRLMCPTFTLIRLILSLLLLLPYSAASSAAVSSLIAMLGGKVASREVVSLSHFLPPLPPLHDNPQLQTGLNVFID